MQNWRDDAARVTRGWLAGAVLAMLFLAHAAVAQQFIQQGPKLAGTDGPVSLSADGNTAILGAPNDNVGAGAAWVWTRSGGVWTQQAKLVGSGAVGSVDFYTWQGFSVCISADGNTAIVGGYGDNGGVGATWVWTRSGGVWTQQGDKLVGSGAVGSAEQGSSVSISADGNTAIVGGPADGLDWGNTIGTGAAWIWTRSGGVWTQQAKLVGSGAVGWLEYSTWQGSSVSISADGNTAIVGGSGDNGGVGATWVWTRSGGVWTQQGDKLVGSGAVTEIPYWVAQGSSVSLSADGNTAIVGGSGDNGGVGAAWIWTRSGGLWTQPAPKMVATDAGGNAERAYQGCSVSISADGNTAIVGGWSDSGRAGAAWIWTRSVGVWTQQGSKLVGSGAVGNAEQGHYVSVSADGNTAIVAGPNDDGAGAAWVFTNSAPICTIACSASGPSSGQTGQSLSFTSLATPSNCSGSVSYLWDFGDGQRSGSQNPSHAYSSAGTYHWTLTASVGSTQCQKTGNVTISAVAAPTVSAINPTSGVTSGGTSVTVAGANFAAGATVTLGGTGAAVVSVTATTIRASTPAHAAGAADVVVRNPDGQTGTLTGGFTFSDTPPEQTPPDRGNLPEDPGQWPTPASKAVVITHGWNGSAAGWVKEMAEKVCGKLGAGYPLFLVKDDYLTKSCQANNWDVWVLDWQSKAANTGLLPDPWEAYANASDLGENLAVNLKVKNYSHIHFIAHSAGANLIDFATGSLKYWAKKENRPTLEIHDTFLDAYDPASDASRYGKQADWTDNYVDTRDVADLFSVAFDGTKLFLQNGYNIDVTPNTASEPCSALGVPKVYDCRHNRPYRFYGLSVDSSFVGDAPSAASDPIHGTDGMGYPLSLESGHSLSLLNNLYPKGAKCVMDGDICYAGSLPPSVWTFLPGAVAGTVVDAAAGAVSYAAGVGATLFNSIKLGMISALPDSSAPLRAAKSTNSTAPTESPSWITVSVTTSQPVNTLRFNWRFEAAGEGFLRVFVDGSLVREIDQRHVSLASLTTEQIYISGGVGTLAPGIHRIAFRLDGFGASASGVELTGVELGLTTVNVASRTPRRHLRRD